MSMQKLDPPPPNSAILAEAAKIMQNAEFETKERLNYARHILRDPILKYYLHKRARQTYNSNYYLKTKQGTVKE